MSDIGFAQAPWSVGELVHKKNYVEISINNSNASSLVAKVVGTTSPLLDYYQGAHCVRESARLG